jgi:hypothetical protein
MTMMIVMPTSKNKNLNTMPNAGCQPKDRCVALTRRMAKTMLMTNRINTPAAIKICAARASPTLCGTDTDAIRRMEVNMRDMQKTCELCQHNRISGAIVIELLRKIKRLGKNLCPLDMFPLNIFMCIAAPIMKSTMKTD